MWGGPPSKVGRSCIAHGIVVGFDYNTEPSRMVMSHKWSVWSMDCCYASLIPTMDPRAWPTENPCRVNDHIRSVSLAGMFPVQQLAGVVFRKSRHGGRRSCKSIIIHHSMGSILWIVAIFHRHHHHHHHHHSYAWMIARTGGFPVVFCIDNGSGLAQCASRHHRHMHG